MTELTAPVIKIYTDGACSGNPGPGAYVAILTFKDKEKILSRHFRLTTNNRMELMAVVDALKALKTEGLPVEIYSDSKYVVDAVNKHWITTWKRKGWKKVKNLDLWLEFDKLHQKYKPKLFWVKGHNNHPYNERCDRMAVEALSKPNPETDVMFEKSLENSGFL